jgi:CheY-like chemotaxis protein
MKQRIPTILGVDDAPDDQALITLAFRKNGVTCPILWTRSGEEAISYLKGEGQYADRSAFPYPTFVMTDLKMRDGDGFAVLQHLKSRPEWAVIPTVVFSGSSDEDDIKRAYMLGAGSYIVKPTDFDELRVRLRIFFDYWTICEVPATDITGKRLPTDSAGKLGARFEAQDSEDEAEQSPSTSPAKRAT